MNKQEFVDEIFWGSVLNRTWCDVESMLNEKDLLPFCGPSENHNSPHCLFSSLSEVQKETLKIALRNAIDSAIWNVLIAFSEQSLGRIRAENEKLVLYHEDKNGERTLLTFSEDDCEELHELFHASDNFPSWILTGEKK